MNRKRGTAEPKQAVPKLKKFLLGGSAEPLAKEDFRSSRLVIPPRAFAYVEKFRVSPDAVDLETWTKLQAAPDDVCIQTTDYHRGTLKVQRHLHSAWINKIGFAQNDALEEDALKGVAFEVEAEWQASTFAATHGFYRQAIETLRTALERTVIALRYQDASTDRRFKDWLEGDETLAFAPICDQVASGSESARALNEHLINSGCIGFIRQKDSKATPTAWVAHLHEKLCRYSHCRPNHASGDLWRGPGPVYDPEAFTLTDRFYRETSAVCWFAAKLARPSLALPDTVRAIVSVAEAKWKAIAQQTVAFLDGARH